MGQRARADGAHLAAQDVDELRQLVEPRRSQDAAGARDAAVAHRSKLQDREAAPASTEPLLTEKERKAIVQHDGERDERHRRQEDDQTPGGTGEIEESLQAHEGRKQLTP